jgi:flagellar hook assembly protein FlgD
MRMATLLLALSNVIMNVAVEPKSVNVTAGDSVTLTVKFASAGVASIAVIDRDGFPVRTLADAQPVGTAFSVGWNGRDDGGFVVPDEAYSFRITWTDGKQAATYFPADRAVEMASVTPRYFDRRSGTLSYVLSQPSRVHVQAGTAIINQKTKAVEGPVMKTIVNREPRIAGVIADHWNGFDESGSIYLPDLPDFAMAIAASPLPEDSVIAFGNRSRSFVEYAAQRKGRSLFTSKASHEHHGGLDAMNDASPTLTIEPLNAKWLASEGLWLTSESSIELRIKATGPTADAFMHQPGRLYRFVNGRLVGRPLNADAHRIAVPLRDSSSRQLVSINWRSDWGPVAANTLAVRRAENAR